MSSKNIVLAVVSTLLFASCAPKDEKLNRPNTGSFVESQSIDDQLKMSFVAFDKQVEALHLLNALMNPEYATAKNLSVSVVSETESVIVKSIKGLSLQKSAKMNHSSQVDMVATLTMDASGRIQSAELVDTGAVTLPHQLFAVSNGEVSSKADLTLALARQKIIFKNLGDGLTQLTVSALSEVTVNNGKKTFEDILKIDTLAVIAWNGDAATLGKVEFRSFDLKNVKHAQAKFELNLKSEKSEMTVDLTGACTRFDGLVVFKSQAKTSDRFTFSLTDSSIEIQNRKTKSTALDCASRPVLDLHRLK
ncbi:MAG: hypothetical protein A2622_00775 [Bdellovibrionales bacterium RIFCSPHIGHO2_01_FULL_40_29]|nr:MAG: hypothetical protein A2622_00775 [Bdellovibrionales bacterium RIFCSPHIGHO2_01_FULL_40_29]OFZ32651.1 MAG: hypothetical protein A3D17_05375 [Bdellovibrionales bacterium RIFCSPHIGHO2_02_FULL_40_15]